MDAYSAWAMFTHTGKVEDYLKYTQMKEAKESQKQEDIHADQYRWIGHYRDSDR